VKPSLHESPVGEEKYRTIFEHSAVSLWEEDISKLRSKLDEMKSRGGVSLRAHVAAQPGFVQQAVRLIEVTDVNKASLLLFEADRKEQLLGPLDIVLDTVSWTALGDTIFAIDEGRTEVEVESSAVTLKGRRLSLIVKAHIPLADAAYPRMVVSLIDITARKDAEKRERESAIILQSIVESFPDSIFVKDASLRMVLCNRILSQAIGKEPKDTYGKTDVENGWSAELVKGNPQKGIAGWEKDDLAALAGKTMQVTEEPTDFDNGVHYFDTSKFPLRDENGIVIGLIGVARDVTDRRRLEATNRQLAALVDSTDDAIVGLDLDRRITVWNRGAERLYGYPAGEIVGAATSILIPPELEDEARALRERLAAGEQLTHFETTRLRKDGSRIIVSLSLSAIRDGKGRIVGMASVARDVTEQKALQSQIERARRLEGLATLAAGIAHQFNNINTVVLGYLAILESAAPLPARLASYAQAATAAVQRASDITRSLLALTEPAGTSADTFRFDVLARHALQGLQGRFDAEKILLVLDLAASPPVQGSESRVRAVMSSLIGNALDSLQDRTVRRITVRTGVTNDCAYFEVEDTGCGIAEDDLPRIFSPFFSSKGEWAPTDSPQAKVRGVGLSLAVSNTSISEHGGRIEVRSTKEVGSAFRVLVPFAR
jgi:PAS domain S-box-containing protein